MYNHRFFCYYDYVDSFKADIEQIVENIDPLS